MRSHQIFTILSFFLFLPFFSHAAFAAKAEIKNAEGAAIGRAQFSGQGADVKMTIEVKGLAPGAHGIHIHSVGKCEGPDFKSAGAHFNPAHKQHGLENPEGHHAGDMPNLTADAEGKAQAEMILQGVSIKAGEPNSLLSPEGTAVVIHASADDEKTDPAGNSGGRIACGVIENS